MKKRHLLAFLIILTSLLIPASQGFAAIEPATIKIANLSCHDLSDLGAAINKALDQAREQGNVRKVAAYRAQAMALEAETIGGLFEGFGGFFRKILFRIGLIDIEPPENIIELSIDAESALLALQFTATDLATLFFGPLGGGVTAVLSEIAAWAGKEIGARGVLQNIGYVEVDKPGVGVMTIIYDKKAGVAWVNIDLDDGEEEWKAKYGWEDEHIYMYLPFDKEPPDLKKPIDFDKWFIYNSREVGGAGPPEAEPALAWSKTFGGAEHDSGFSVQQTSDGGYILIGGTESYGAGDADVWLIKTDSSGNEIWDKTFGGAKEDAGVSVQQTMDGGYMIAGLTQSYGAGGHDVWLIKTDSNGTNVWDKTFGGASSSVAWSMGWSLEQTLDGGYIMVGSTESYGVGGCDVWLIKTDSSGNEIWDKTFGGAKDDMGASVQQTSDGGYILIGGTASYGAGGSAAWLIKTDSDGNKLWDKTFRGENKYGGGLSVQQTLDGGYIIVGSTKFDGAGVSDAWLIKTDSSGNKVWDKTFGGTGDKNGLSVQQTSDGGYIIVVGWIEPESYEEVDAWLIKTNPNGDKVWDRTLGGEEYDIVFSVQQTSDGGYITVGGTQSYGAGKTDVWLLKLGAGGQQPQFAEEDVDWLAKTIASEAGSVYDKDNWVRCSDEERSAVGWTVLNRLEAGTFGATIEEVVTARGQYAHNQEPTSGIRELAEKLLSGKIPDPTGGATYFFSPISMPWEGDEGKHIPRLKKHFDDFDTAGGLHEVPGLANRVYFPSWTQTFIWVGDLNKVRRAYFMFYRPSFAPTTPTSEVSGKIAFVSDRDGNKEIYLMDVTGENQIDLTSHPADDWSPAWSPDGSKIAFTSDRDGDNEIYVMNNDGGNVVQLTSNSNEDDRPKWSPDGKSIIFYSDRNGDDEIYMMAADGGNQRDLTNHPGFDGYPCCWSPDGQKIVFSSERGEYPESMFKLLYIMNIDGTEADLLLHGPGLGIAGAESLIATDWSPDGKYIAYTTYGIGYQEMHLCDIETQYGHLLGEFLGNKITGTFSPDSKWLSFSSKTGDNWEIYVRNLETDETKRLTTNSADDNDPNWSQAP